MIQIKSKFNKKFKAAILCQLKKPLKVKEIELPKYLSYGQILVKLNYSSVCGSQIGEIDGVKGKDDFLPHLLGHEGVGKILQVGPGVKKVKEGDTVVLHWMIGNGINSETPEYKHDNSIINAGWVTTFNELAIVSENRMTKIESKMDKKFLSLFGCAVTTGFGSVLNDANLRLLQSIVIAGVGGVGINMIIAAKYMNAYPIVALDKDEKKLNIAKKYGATHTINTLKDKLEKKFYEEYDIFIDNTGNTKIIEFGYKIIRKEGKLILVGVPKYDKNINIHSLDLHFGKQIIGSFGGNTKPEVDIQKYISFFLRNKISLKEMISKTYKITEINMAIEDVRNNKLTCKALITF